MSTRGSRSMRAGSSVVDSMRGSDARTARSRGSTTEFSLNVESSHHSYPKTPGTIPMAYGQTRDTRMYPGGLQQHSPRQGGYNNVYRPQQMTHGLPGGPGATSPFSVHDPAAGFPVAPPYRANAISPLPYNTSGPLPANMVPYGSPPQPYTMSAPMYHDPDYARRYHTTGSILPGQHGGVNLTPASTSYSTPFNLGQQPQPQQPNPLKSHADYADDCFNIFWLFFLLGPLTWPCGLFGICSDKQSERMAGLVSGVCLVLVIIAVVIVITQAPDDSNSDSGQ